MARPGLIYNISGYKNRLNPYIYLDHQAIHTLRLKESGIIFNWTVDTETKSLCFVAAKIESTDFFTIAWYGGCLATISGEVLVPAGLDQIKMAYKRLLTS